MSITYFKRLDLKIGAVLQILNLLNHETMARGHVFVHGMPYALINSPEPYIERRTLAKNSIVLTIGLHADYRI